MKMLVIACDGHGAFRCALVRNPDLFRRQIAAQTGHGDIVWAGMSVLASDPGGALAHIKSHVLPRFTARPRLQHDPAFVTALVWATLGRPMLGLAARTIRNCGRKTFWPLSLSRLRHLVRTRRSGDQT